MATQPHDVGLVWIHERAHFVGEQDSTFLTLSPLGGVLKQVEQEVLVPQDECVARDVLPKKVHGRVFHEAIPGVMDVLTDVVEQCFHCERSHMCRMDEDIESEQGNFLEATQARKFTAGCHVHMVMSHFRQDRTDLIQVGNNQYSASVPHWGNISPGIPVLVIPWPRLVGFSPHGWVVPRAGAIRWGTYVIR